MLLRPEAGGHYRLTFLLLPGYSMAALQAAIDPLRQANRILGEECYQWRLLGLSTAPVEASNGMCLPSSDYQYELPANLFVCAGQQLWQENHPLLLWWLQTLYRQKSVLAGMGGGSHLLAQAKLLNKGEVSMQGPAARQFSQRYPQLTVSDAPYVLASGDNDCTSCAGGFAAGHLMLQLIRQHSDTNIAEKVAGMLMLSEPVTAISARQVQDMRLTKAVSLMQANLEAPLNTTQLAEQVHISPRHLERLFKRHFDMTPGAYYLRIRLQTARKLVAESDGEIKVIAGLCGFKSSAHFSRSYSRHFGIGPGRDRRQQRV